MAVYLIFKDGEEIEIDATLSLTRGSTNETTDHPIEDGSSITDYVIRQPRTYNISGFMSNVPMNPQGGAFAFLDISNLGNVITSAFRGPQSFFGGLLSPYTKYDPTADGYHQYANDKFQQAIDDAEEVEIDAGHRGIFGPLQITSYSVNWDVEHGSGLPFTMDFKEIIKVNSAENSLQTLLGAAANLLSGAFQNADIARQFNKVTDTGLIGTVASTVKQVSTLTDIDAVGSLSTATDFIRGA